jgi:hypothetical protein
VRQEWRLDQGSSSSSVRVDTVAGQDRLLLGASAKMRKSTPGKLLERQNPLERISVLANMRIQAPGAYHSTWMNFQKLIFPLLEKLPNS